MKKVILSIFLFLPFLVQAQTDSLYQNTFSEIEAMLEGKLLTSKKQFSL